MDMTAGMNLALTAQNINDFLSIQTSMKAILFTKKAETPGLWLRLIEAFRDRYSFGEVRQTEELLLRQFGVSPDSLPKIVTIQMLDGSPAIAMYDGPNEFERIKEFFMDSADGGILAIELRRTLENAQRELRALQSELSKEKEANQSAMAEIARMKLGQVGHVEAVRKTLELELNAVKKSEENMKMALSAEIEALKSSSEALEAENSSLQQKLRAHEAMQDQVVVVLTSANIQSFLTSLYRPLKAVLFTTKSETPALWQQLARTQSLTTSFGLVRHSEDELMTRFKLRSDDLPRIYLFGNGNEVPMPYDGPVNLEAISAFLKDAVEGGPACLEMRRLLHVGLREMEGLRQEIARAEQEREEAKSALGQMHKVEVEPLRRQVATLQTALSAAAAAADNARKDVEERVRRERAEMERRMAEAILAKEAQLQAEVEEERENWRQACHMHALLDSALKGAERAAKSADKAMLKAASTVHVAMVRWARDRERMHASLSHFISDIAPCQLPAPSHTVSHGGRNGGEKGGTVGEEGVDDLRGGLVLGGIWQQLKTLKAQLVSPLNRQTNVTSEGAASRGKGDTAETSCASSEVSVSTSEASARTRNAHGVQHVGETKGGEMAGVMEGGREYMSAYESMSRRSNNGPDWMQPVKPDATLPSQTVTGVAGRDQGDRKNDGGRREKVRQRDDVVTLRGYSNVTIGQLTREVTKTGNKDVFRWRDRTIRLVYLDGRRDRLIDENTGEVVYVYPPRRQPQQSASASQGAGRGGETSIQRSEGEPEASHGAGSVSSGTVQSSSAKYLFFPSRLSSSSTASHKPSHEQAPQDEGGMCGPGADRCISTSPKRQKKRAVKRLPSLVKGLVVMAGVPAHGGDDSSAESAKRWSPCSEEEVDDADEYYHSNDRTGAQKLQLGRDEAWRHKSREMGSEADPAGRIVTGETGNNRRKDGWMGKATGGHGVEGGSGVGGGRQKMGVWGGGDGTRWGEEARAEGGDENDEVLSSNALCAPIHSVR